MNNGQGVIQDFFLGDKENMVLADDQQDISDLTVTYEDDTLILEFTKSGNTNDDKDIRLSGECVFLLMPDVGGPVVDGQPMYHTQAPRSTPEKFCFTTCKDPNASVSIYATTWLTLFLSLFILILCL
ncbi:uncharacterized protein LOC117124337 [Anneissia japonica]|uniref:uncharacterized protein LOC117124337 n=1 Tax=Anneissia japonica TaxID=1529436 RepID=UPI001425618A|nr:uncharacterized protein LOC117124337 [Anneissia japonica]